MKDINLLYRIQTEKSASALNKTRRRAIVLISVMTFLLAASYGALWYGTDYYTAETSLLKAEAASYSAVQEAKTAAALKKSEIESIRELIGVSESTSYTDTALLETLSSCLYKYTFLTNLVVNENGLINMTGKAATRPDIANLIYTLKQTSLFSNVSVNVINAEGHDARPADAGAYDFTLTATIKGGKAGE